MADERQPMTLAEAHKQYRTAFIEGTAVSQEAADLLVEDVMAQQNLNPMFERPDGILRQNLGLNEITLMPLKGSRD